MKSSLSGAAPTRVTLAILRTLSEVSASISESPGVLSMRSSVLPAMATFGLATLVLAGSVLTGSALTAAPALATTPACAGQPATMVVAGGTSTALGTDGADVIFVEARDTTV